MRPLKSSPPPTRSAPTVKLRGPRFFWPLPIVKTETAKKPTDGCKKRTKRCIHRRTRGAGWYRSPGICNWSWIYCARRLAERCRSIHKAKMPQEKRGHHGGGEEKVPLWFKPLPAFPSRQSHRPVWERAMQDSPGKTHHVAG